MQFTVLATLLASASAFMVAPTAPLAASKSALSAFSDPGVSPRHQFSGVGD